MCACVILSSEIENIIAEEDRRTRLFGCRRREYNIIRLEMNEFTIISIELGLQLLLRKLDLLLLLWLIGC